MTLIILILVMINNINAITMHGVFEQMCTIYMYINEPKRIQLSKYVDVSCL